MPNERRDVHRVFQALSDPTRCRVIERLAIGPASTSNLAHEFDMALPSFLQHLGVLSDIGLVTSTKNGRVRTYALDASGLELVADWLTDNRKVWEQRLDQLEELVTRVHQQESENT